MSSRKVDIPNIDTVVNLLGLERSPKARPQATTYMVRCPFCSNPIEHKYHMKIDTVHGVYHCYTCGNGQKGTGTLDLYARVRMGVPHQKGENGNGQEILEKLSQELGYHAVAQPHLYRTRTRQKQTASESVSIASDAILSRVYAFLFAFPEFRLEEQHRKNLINRGLDDAAIQRNGYASMPKDIHWIKHYPAYGELYDALGIEKEKAKWDKLSKVPRGRIIAGLILAGEMEKVGIVPKGVPGAFKICGHWCFVYQPGMMVPTRNQKGQIVAFQTRTDKGDVRYLTYSSSTLDMGVESNISRTHFPLANAKPQDASEVLITEGPLKADVAVHLFGSPVHIMAIHGVGNTRELGTICRNLKVQGVMKIGNAFDMDKLCNINVRRSSRALHEIIHKSGLAVYQKCWDPEYAKVKWAELHDLCVKHHVPVSCSLNDIFCQIAIMADALHTANIPCCIKQGKQGLEKDYWTDRTKGLDDMLLHRNRS